MYNEEIIRLQNILNELLECEDIDNATLLEVSTKLDGLILEFYSGNNLKEE